MMRTGTLLLLVLCLLIVPLSAQGEDKGTDRILIVKDYRYLPADPPGDADTGQALCGTRCNALSSDYLNYIEPGGWRVIKVAEGREIQVELGNPFMPGTCVCVVDEFVVRIDDLMTSTDKKK